VSRHLAFGRTPCLGCIYRPRTGGKSEAELVAEAMRIAEPAAEVRELLYSGAPIGEPFIKGVAARRGIVEAESVAILVRYASRSLREFYQEAFCGGLMLTLGGEADTAAVRAEAPMAFQSALAGVMLASELVIDAGGLREPHHEATPTRTTINLLRPLTVYAPTVSRSSDGRCFCDDPDYLRVYETKYGISARACE